MSIYSQLLLSKYQSVYVIGDIHGCARELTVLLDYLGSLEQSRTALFVFLGDYINRGHSSRLTINQLIEFKKTYTNCHFLTGNHDYMFLSYLGLNSSDGTIFMNNIGQQTLADYQLNKRLNFEQRQAKMPEAHLDFFKQLDSYIITEDYVFVHAGLSPLVELDQQLPKDIYWIRDEFINNPHNFSKTVIFGHTPFKEVLLDLPYKIGLDTGLVLGNKLSCLELQSGTLLQIKLNSKKVIVRESFI